jgi:WD40 repeat protein
MLRAMRRQALAMVLAVLLGAAFAGAACRQSPPKVDGPQPTERPPETMNRDAAPVPIDDAAPVRIETETLAEIPGQRGSRLAFAPDGKSWFVARSMDGVLYREATELKRVASPGAWLSQPSFSPDGRTLSLGPYRYDLAADRFFTPPGVENALLVRVPSVRDTAFGIASAAFSPDGDLLVVLARHAPSGDLDTGPPYLGPTGRLLALDGRTGSLLRVLWEGMDYECSVLHVGDRLVLAGGVGLRVFERPGLGQRAAVKAHKGTQVNALALFPDGTQVATAGANGEIAIWTLPALDAVRAFKAHDGRARALALHPGLSAGPGAPVAPGGAPLLVSGGDDGRLAWSTTGGRLLADFPQGGPVEGLALSPSGDRMVVAVGGPSPSLRYQRVTVSLR